MAIVYYVFVLWQTIKCVLGVTELQSIIGKYKTGLKWERVYHIGNKTGRIKKEKFKNVMKVVFH